MRLLWTLLKVVIGLAIAIPLGIIVLGTALGILGALIGLAVIVLKLAVLGVCGLVLFRVARFFFGSSPKPQPRPVGELRPVDPYYTQAMRELDSELGHGTGR
jgi:hypothetical protein